METSSRPYESDRNLNISIPGVPEYFNHLIIIYCKISINEINFLYWRNNTFLNLPQFFHFSLSEVLLSPMYQTCAKYKISIKILFLFILTLDVEKEKNNWKVSQNGIYYPSKRKVCRTCEKEYLTEEIDNDSVDGVFDFLEILTNCLHEKFDEIIKEDTDKKPFVKALTRIFSQGILRIAIEKLLSLLS